MQLDLYMQKFIFILLVFFSNFGHADNPLNFEHSIHCLMDETCQKNRFEWVAYELSYQFTRTIYLQDVWINSLDAEASTMADAKNLFFMTLDNYTEELDRFLELYAYLNNNMSDIQDLELRNFFIDLSYAWSTLVAPLSFEIVKQNINALTETERISIGRLSNMIAKLSEIRAQQKNKNQDLIVPASDEIVLYSLFLSEEEVDGSDATFLNIEKANYYIVSKESVLREVAPGIPNSIDLNAVNMDEYLYLKSIKQALSELFEQGLHEDPSDEPENTQKVPL